MKLFVGFVTELIRYPPAVPTGYVQEHGGSAVKNYYIFAKEIHVCPFKFPIDRGHCVWGGIILNFICYRKYDHQLKYGGTFFTRVDVVSVRRIIVKSSFFVLTKSM